MAVQLTTEERVPLFLRLAKAFQSAPSLSQAEALRQHCAAFTDACLQLPMRQTLARHQLLPKALAPLLALILRRLVGERFGTVGVEGSHVWSQLKGIPDMSLLHLAQALVRLMRNACAGVKQNQLWAAECCGEPLQRAAAQLRLLLRGSERWNHEVVVFIKSGLQAMSNAVIDNPKVARLYAQKRYPEGVTCAVVANREHPEVGFDVLRLCMILINSCMAHEVYLRQFCATAGHIGPKAVVHITHQAAAMCVGNGPFDGKDPPKDREKAENVLHVGIWIISKIATIEEMWGVLDALDPPDDELFLCMWLEAVECDDWKSPGPKPMVKLVNYYKALVAARSVKLKTLALRILAAYTAQDASYSGETQDQRELLRIVLAELKNGAQNPPEYKSELMRVVANVCLRRKVNQDFVRTHDEGILTILNNVHVEGNTSFLREWGVFAIRNLCEGNEENQQAIAQLRIQGVADNKLLEKAGLQVELTKDGAPKVVKRKP